MCQTIRKWCQKYRSTFLDVLDGQLKFNLDAAYCSLFKHKQGRLLRHQDQPLLARSSSVPLWSREERRYYTVRESQKAAHKKKQTQNAASPYRPFALARTRLWRRVTQWSVSALAGSANGAAAVLRNKILVFFSFAK